MNLTLQTDYAFRTMMFLAVKEPELAKIQEISEHYKISRGHLMVIVNKLGNLGYLNTVRGRGGGIRLLRPAKDIRLGDVVLAMEPHFDLVECFNPKADQCLISAPCRLRGVLHEALAAWFEVLNTYTLADLVKRNAELTTLLTISGARPLDLPTRMQ